MLVFLVLALGVRAADPADASAPAAAPPPAAAAAAAAPVDAAHLRRTCAEGQLCDGRCIPWSAPCASTVRDVLADAERQRRVAELGAIVCGPKPAPPAPPSATVEEQILLSVAAGTLCGVTGASAAGTCDSSGGAPDPRLIGAPLTPGPPCGEAPPPAAAPPAAPPAGR